MARVRALFRRTYSEPDTAVDVLDYGTLTIDISGHKDSHQQLEKLT